MIESKSGRLKVSGDMDTVFNELCIVILGLRDYFNINEILKDIENGNIKETHTGITIEKSKNNIIITEE
ncbi:hypothetical protein IKD56_00865 [bacterium]|nr:hypothetical protein [bacterium]